ncbi:hypothetical protein Bca4012_024974 [Brassica carinata]
MPFMFFIFIDPEFCMCFLFEVPGFTCYRWHDLFRNINGKPFRFSFAYHTYLAVSDISKKDLLTEQYDSNNLWILGKDVNIDSEEQISLPKVVADHERKRTYVIGKGLLDTGTMSTKTYFVWMVITLKP